MPELIRTDVPAINYFEIGSSVSANGGDWRNEARVKYVHAIAPSAVENTGGGWGFALVMIYMFFDVTRPTFTWHFPKILSVLMVIAWAGSANKKFPRQIIYMLLFVVEMWIDVPFSVNTGKAFWESYGMGMLVVTFCLPFVQFVNSRSRFQTAMNILLGIYTIIGAWACLHKGYGPGGADAAQDENYVATWMAMAIPLAVYAFLAGTGKVKKFWFLVPIPVLLGGVLLAENPSRGGFLGILVVLGYFVFFSKKRMMTLVSIGVITLFVLAMASSTFLVEMGTIGNPDSGTADQRKDLWFIATRMFLDNPIAGVGPANFRWRIGDYETPELIEKYRHSLSGTYVTHSLYFELIADLGGVGAFLFGIIAFQSFRDLVAVRKSVDRISVRTDGEVCEISESKVIHNGDLTWLRYYAHGLAASLIGCLVCSAFLSTLYLSYFWLLCTIIASFKLVADQLLPATGDEVTSWKKVLRWKYSKM